MSGNLDSFTQVQKMLSKAKCPHCSGDHLELKLHCEMGRKCIHQASCQDCNLTFEVKSGYELPKTVQELLPQLSCPECANVGAEFAIVCETKTRSCEPVVSCSSCEYTYQNRSRVGEVA